VFRRLLEGIFQDGSKKGLEMNPIGRGNWQEGGYFGNMPNQAKHALFIFFGLEFY
jgi:hypothetical protein